MEALFFSLGIIGNVLSFLMYFAPAITFKRIIKNKSTGDFSVVPYVMTMLSCLLYAWYGLPFVSPHNLFVTTVGVTGASIEMVYVGIFIAYTPKKEKCKVLGLLFAVAMVLSVIAMVSLLALHGNRRKLFCGFIGAIVSVIMFASPLSIMRTVIKTKSVEYMPFLLSLFMFLCGITWFLFGLLGADHFVYVPNGCGCGLGALQLVIYFIYRDKKGPTKKLSADTSMDIGVTKFDQEKRDELTV